MRLRAYFDGKGDVATVLRGAGVVFLVRGSGAALIYLSQLLLARWMGQAEFGVYAYVWSWAILLAIPAGLGLTSSALRFIPEYTAHENWARLAGFLRRAWLFAVVTSLIIGAAAAVVVAMMKGHIAPYYVVPLWIGFGCIVPLALFDLHMEMSRGFGWPALAYAPKMIGMPLLLVGGVGLAAWLGTAPTASVVVAIALASASVLALVQGRTIWAHLSSEIRKIRPVFETRTWLRVGMPLLLASSFHMVIGQTDSIMIGAFLRPEDVAIYYAASRTAVLVNLIPVAVSALAAPKIAALWAQNRLDDTQTMLSKLIPWSCFSALAAALVLSVYGTPILSLFGPGFAAGYGALVILVLGQVVNAGAGLTGYVLALTGHHGLNAWVMGCSAGLNVVLNALLIPMFGVLGAALATAATTIIWNVWLWALTRRKVGLDPSILSVLDARR